jgi:aminoglycoside phosphotransferase (APT) family kinase protein
VRLTYAGAYVREARFYREIAPSTGLCAPRCYYAAADGETGYSLLLLQDMPCARPGDVLVGCSTLEAEALVRSIAAFHARWWGSPGLETLDWVRSFDGDPMRWVQRYRRLWPVFAARYSGLIPASLAAMGERIPDHVPDLYRALAARPATLVHGDFHLANVLFDTPGGQFAVVDWQLIARGPGALDLALFLVWSLPVEQRRADEDRLIRAYHEALREAGVGDYSLEECRSDVRLSLLLYLLKLIGGHAELDFSSPRSARVAAAWIERCHAALQDHDAWRGLGLLPAGWPDGTGGGAP